MKAWAAHTRCYNVICAKTLDVSNEATFRADTKLWMTDMKHLCPDDLQVRRLIHNQLQCASNLCLHLQRTNFEAALYFWDIMVYLGPGGRVLNLKPLEHRHQPNRWFAQERSNNKDPSGEQILTMVCTRVQ